MIIDIYGFPGSGKSGLALKLVEIMEANNCNDTVVLFNKNEYNNHNFIEKNTLFWIKLFNKNFFKMYFKISKKIVENKLNIHQSFKSKLRDKLRLSILYSFIMSPIKKDTVVIIDQGIIQDFMELSLKYNIYNENIYNDYVNMILGSKNKIKFIRLDTDEEESLNRIKKRNRKQYEFDNLSEKELIEYFKKEKKLMNRFDSSLKSKLCKIDGNYQNIGNDKLYNMIRGEN